MSNLEKTSNLGKTPLAKKVYIDSNFHHPAGRVPRVPSPTSGHLQPYVPLDVVEEAGDLHAAAVHARILRPGRADRQGHVSSGNAPEQAVPPRCSGHHPAATGVQDFVPALWIRAGASAPAHVGDVLGPRHPVGAGQCHRLSYRPSNNGFRYRVCCQGEERGGILSLSGGDTAYTAQGVSKHSCLRAGHSCWAPRLLLHLMPRGTTGNSQHLSGFALLLALVLASCWREAHKIHQICGEQSWGLSLAAQVQTGPLQMEFENSDPISSPRRLFESCSEPCCERHLVFSAHHHLLWKGNAVTVAFHWQSQKQGPKYLFMCEIRA